jgi:hypothetical protein
MVLQKIYQNKTDEFIQAIAGQEELQRYRIANEVAAVLGAGLQISGARYFEDLFVTSETVTTDDRLVSILVGCTALKMNNQAEEARDRFFARQGQSEHTHRTLSRALLEQSHVEDSISTAQLLRNASKQLIHCRTAMPGIVLAEEVEPIFSAQVAA